MPASQSPSGMNIRWLALLTATILVSVIFFRVISPFIVPLILAAIASAMMQPANNWLCAALGGRKRISSILTLLFLAAVILGPLFGLVYLAAAWAGSGGAFRVDLVDVVRLYG